MIRAVNDDIAESKRECSKLRQDKEMLEHQLTAKSQDVRKKLQLEADR